MEQPFIHKSVKHIRQLKDMEIKYVASLMGISVQAYCKIERGETKINEQHIDKLSQILKVQPSVFYTFNPERMLQIIY